MSKFISDGDLENLKYLIDCLLAETPLGIYSAITYSDEEECVECFFCTANVKGGKLKVDLHDLNCPVNRALELAKLFKQ